MPRLRLLLVRHGESEANLEGRMQGRLDSPLSALGRRQAQAIANRIAKEGQIDALYSSPLRRALQTAQTIGDRVGLTPILVDATRPAGCAPTGRASGCGSVQTS